MYCTEVVAAADCDVCNIIVAQTPPPFAPPTEMPIWPDDNKSDASPSASSEDAPSTTAVAATTTTVAVVNDGETQAVAESATTTVVAATSADSGAAVDNERASKLEQQKSSPWAQFLRSDELIVHTSLITKKKGTSGESMA
jgi:hypothetical protein